MYAHMQNIIFVSNDNCICNTNYTLSIISTNDLVCEIGKIHLVKIFGTHRTLTYLIFILKLCIIIDMFIEYVEQKIVSLYISAINT